MIALASATFAPARGRPRSSGIVAVSVRSGAPPRTPAPGPASPRRRTGPSRTRARRWCLCRGSRGRRARRAPPLPARRPGSARRGRCQRSRRRSRRAYGRPRPRAVHSAHDCSATPHCSSPPPLVIESPKARTPEHWPRNANNVSGMESLRGQLLIASPALIDPNFHRTVILIAEHTGEGAMGLVLNRPAETLVSDVVPDLRARRGGRPGLLRGPVASDSVIVLAEFDDPQLAGVLLEDDLGFVGSESGELATSPTACARARLRRPRRLGPRPARGRARRGTRGSSSLSSARRSSPRTPRACGRRCCAARGASTRCSPPCRRTRRSTRSTASPTLIGRAPGSNEARSRSRMHPCRPTPTTSTTSSPRSPRV